MSKHIETGRQCAGSPIVFKSGTPVSVIWVAATFTSVSYANNGGKVQLISAGVHGLTTSPAVGASVYVSWSGGTGVSGLYKVLSVDSTTAITIGLSYVVGLGTPSVASLNTQIIVDTISLPTLIKGSWINIAGGITFSVASTAYKSFGCILNNQASPSLSSYTSVATHTTLRIDGAYIYIGDGFYRTTHITAINAGSANTFQEGPLASLANNKLSFFVLLDTANIAITLRHYKVEVYI